MPGRLADRNRGTKKFPHWHAGKAWEKHTDMTRTRFMKMSEDEFVEYVCGERNYEQAQAFFYALRWPEGLHYARTSEGWVRKTCYPGLRKHESNWPSALL